MIILGITGAIGHGKTTLAAAFLRQVKGAQHIESSTLISRVADELNKHFLPSKPTSDNIAAINAWLSHLPGILQTIAHHPSELTPIHIPPQHNLHSDPAYQKLAEYLDLVATNHSLVTQTITEANKETYRPLLQWIGGFVTKQMDPTLWYDELIRRANQAEAEGCPLFVVGGVRFPSDAQVVHTAGGKIVAIERPDLAKQDTADPTEAFRSMVPTDTTIINDGDMGALDHVVVMLWQDVQNEELKTRYQATRLAFDASGAPSIQSRELL